MKINPSSTQGQNLKKLRFIGSLILISVLGFVLLGAISIALYPGGNIFSRKVQGYHFWHNFLCDALESRAWNFQPNVWGSRFGLVAMASLALGGLLPSWLLVPHLISSHKRLNRMIQGLGLLCILGLLLMLGEAFVRMPLSHTVLIVIAGFPGFAATLLFILLLFLEPKMPKHISLFGSLVLGTSIINMALYLHVQWFGGRVAPSLPISQKIATFLLLIWLSSIGFYLLKQSKESS